MVDRRDLRPMVVGLVKGYGMLITYIFLISFWLRLFVGCCGLPPTSALSYFFTQGTGTDFE